MTAWLARSIGRKLAASFVAIFCLTYLLTALFVFTSVRASMTQSEVQVLRQMAGQKLEMVASSVSGLATNLRAWSQLEVMNDMISGDVDKLVARTLHSIKRQYGLAGAIYAIYAFDARDKLVAGSNPVPPGAGLPPAWHNESAALRLSDKHRDPQLGAQRYVAGYSDQHHALLNDWHVVALKDADQAFEPIRAVAVKLIGLGFLLTIPIVLAIRWLARKLTAPIEGLTRVVSGITSAGDLERRADIASADEMGTLARTFNNMAEHLQRWPGAHCRRSA